MSVNVGSSQLQLSNAVRCLVWKVVTLGGGVEFGQGSVGRYLQLESADSLWI